MPVSSRAVGWLTDAILAGVCVGVANFVILYLIAWVLVIIALAIRTPAAGDRPGR